MTGVTPATSSAWEVHHGCNNLLSWPLNRRRFGVRIPTSTRLLIPSLIDWKLCEYAAGAKHWWYLSFSMVIGLILGYASLRNGECTLLAYIVQFCPATVDSYAAKVTEILTKYLTASLSASTAHAQCGLAQFLEGILWKFVSWFYLCKNFYNRLRIAKVMGFLLRGCFFLLTVYVLTLSPRPTSRQVGPQSLLRLPPGHPSIAAAAPQPRKGRPTDPVHSVLCWSFDTRNIFI